MSFLGRLFGGDMRVAEQAAAQHVEPLTYPATFSFSLLGGDVIVPTGQGSGLQCSLGITFGPPTGIPPGTYDPNDNSVFTISFREDESDDCGGGKDVTVQLTRQ